MIASKLACGNPESITPFIDSAFSELRHMESNLKSALDARNAGQPVPEELVKDFVRGTGQLTSSASQLLTGSNREVSDNLLLELANYSSRSVASDAGLAVVQKLAEEQKTSEATREMCADHVDALLEGCFEVVQSLAAGLEKVRTLLKKHSDPEAECFAEKVEHTPQVGAMVHGLEQEMAFQPQTEAMVVSHLEEPVQAEAKAVFSLEQPQAETMTVFSLEQPQVAAMMMSSVELPQAEAMMSSAWEEPVHAEAMMMSSSLEEVCTHVSQECEMTWLIDFVGLHLILATGFMPGFRYLLLTGDRCGKEVSARAKFRHSAR